MSILLFGEKADRTHENQMLRAFIQALKADWENTDKDLILIANSMWNGAEIDLVCILPSAILVVDFKHYSGHLIAAENGPWDIDGIVVKGGSKTNPFQQLRDNRFSVMRWLENNHLMSGRNLGHINVAAVFTGPITGKPSFAGTASYWFHTSDLASCSAVLADLSSTELKVYPDDIKEIISALGAEELTWDYGQANRNTEKAKQVPTVAVIPVQNNSSFEQQKLNGGTPLTNTVKTSADVLTNLVPAQKSRLSGMFKSAAVVGGIFLMMAVVSQIYPVIGQSSTITIDEPTQQVQEVQPEKTVVRTARPQPAQIPAYTQKKSTTSLDNYIETHSASNYVGQEVTACGTVAEYTPFKKGAYLNFDRPYPQQTLTLVIWGQMFSSIESKLGPVSDLTGVDLCAHGYIEQYNKRLQIQIAGASAVQLKSTYVKTVANKTQANTAGAERIPAYKAPFYVGKEVMACGVLSGTSRFSKGIYLNLDKPYPNQTLTVVVWNESVAPIEAKFGSLDRNIGKTFCALGTIEKYKKHLQIQIDNPQFLRLMQ